MRTCLRNVLQHEKAICDDKSKRVRRQVGASLSRTARSGSLACGCCSGAGRVGQEVPQTRRRATISAISDRRHKKDIRALDADLGLDFVEKLKPVSYRFNNGDETERYGFVAQDLEQALPASLHGTIERSQPEHGLALIERQNDKDRTYRVSYGELTAPIVKSIQQQQQEITELRQQNAELRRALADQATAFKAENDALRRSIEALKERVTAARSRFASSHPMALAQGIQNRHCMGSQRREKMPGVPVFLARTPQLLNADGFVTFSLPIFNAGAEPAASVFFTEMRLGPAKRVEPLDMPVFAGMLGVNQLIFANGRFSSNSLAVGGQYSITIEGTYRLQGSTYSFQVNRFVTIPPQLPAPIQFLKAHIDVSESVGVLNYSLFNDEAARSPYFINAFSLDIVAPIATSESPPGWQVMTDSHSYVLWHAADSQAHYPNQIPPGQSLVGFVIHASFRQTESTPFLLTSWDHQANKAGLVAFGTVRSPARSI
jgi:hypothetical protein